MSKAVKIPHSKRKVTRADHTRQEPELPSGRAAPRPVFPPCGNELLDTEFIKL